MTLEIVFRNHDLSALQIGAERIVNKGLAFLQLQCFVSNGAFVPCWQAQKNLFFYSNLEGFMHYSRMVTPVDSLVVTHLQQYVLKNGPRYKQTMYGSVFCTAPYLCLWKWLWSHFVTSLASLFSSYHVGDVVAVRKFCHRNSNQDGGKSSFPPLSQL